MSPHPAGSRSESEIDIADALARLRQAGLRLDPGVDASALRVAIGAETLAARPLSALLLLLGLGGRFAEELPAGEFTRGALCADMLTLAARQTARIDPAAALASMAQLSGQSARLSALQTLQPGDGFEYLVFSLDERRREIVIDATAGFDPTAELGRLARLLERGRKAFYLHRRGALLILLYLHEESAEALNAAEPGLLEALSSLEVDSPLLRLSRKTLRRLPVLLFALAALLFCASFGFGVDFFGLGQAAYGAGALVFGATSLAAARG